MNEFKICKEVYNTEQDSNSEPTYNLEIDGTQYSGLSMDEAIAIVEDSNYSNSVNYYENTYSDQEPKTIKLSEYCVVILDVLVVVVEVYVI